MSKANLKETEWHVLPLSRIFHLLKTSAKGLAGRQIQKNLQAYGLNKLPEGKKTSSLVILLSQLKSPLVYVLIFALIISLILKEWNDSVVIGLVVVLNTIFGWWQENKANNAIAKLKNMSIYHAKVLRDGNPVTIDIEQLTLGDVVMLRSGDKIPADCRIVSSEDFSTMEAMLTGESLPVSKKNSILPVGAALAERKNMVYRGTNAVRGHALAVVCAIGGQTQIGQIGQMISETKDEKTPLQNQLDEFSRFLAIVIGSVCLFVLLLGLVRGYEFNHILVVASALAVSAIPEGLLVAVTVILAIGMQKILTRKSLVRKLVAAETLGSISVICTDKTGTLTEGKMRVHKLLIAEQDFIKGGEYDESRESAWLKEKSLLSKISVLCSNAVIENLDAPLDQLKVIGDPTESALLLAAIESGFDSKELEKEYPRLEELPFDSEKKFMATLNHHKNDSHYHVFVKGAPEKIFGFCNQILIDGHKKNLTTAHLLSLKNRSQALARDGLRILALAYKTQSQRPKNLANELDDLVLVGLVALKDPLRPEAKKAINTCHQAGIRPILITGDHPLTAQAIFKELELKTTGRIIDGVELDKLSDEEFMKKINHFDIYARVEPRHKLRIVKALQALGETVAMTGDGINDAPAIKGADIGIALGSGSDVAKETSDLILLDNNFSTIVESVREGRVIFDNIRKVNLYLLVDSFSEIIIIVGALAVGLPLPLLAIQILWINLLNDGLPNLALALEKEEGDVMSYPPRRKDESIFNFDLKVLLAVGFVTDAIMLVIFYYLIGQGSDFNYARTIVFSVLAFDSLLYAFSVRNIRTVIFKSNPFSNRYLVAAVSFSFFLLVLTIYTKWGNYFLETVPLEISGVLLVLAIALLKPVLLEFSKFFLSLKNKKYA